MKFGFRKPNIKKSIKAKTTGKLKRKAKSAVNPLYGKKGMGFVKNPEQAIKNKIYHQTTIGVSDIINSGSKASKKPAQKKSSGTTPNPYMMQAENDIRIIQETLPILDTTTKPDVFFSRLDLLKQTGLDLQSIEPYVSLTVSPTQAIREMMNNEQEVIYQFIVRYFNSVWSYAETLKTDKGKNNQYQKFYDTMMSYSNRLNESNLKYIEYKYNQSIVK